MQADRLEPRLLPGILGILLTWVFFWNSRKRLNVESPSFTPSGTPLNGAIGGKKTTISPKAANAAPFLPKGIISRTAPCKHGWLINADRRLWKGSNTGTPPVRQENATPDWSFTEVPEFVPQGFDATQMVSRPVLLYSRAHSNGI